MNPWQTSIRSQLLVVDPINQYSEVETATRKSFGVALGGKTGTRAFEY